MRRPLAHALLLAVLVLPSPRLRAGGAGLLSSSELRSMFQKKKAERLLRTIQERSAANEDPSLSKAGQFRNARPTAKAPDVLGQFDAPAPPPAPSVVPRPHDRRAPAPQETIVVAPDPSGNRVAVRVADLDALGPPKPPEAPAAPAAPRPFGPGHARLHLDGKAAVAELHWTFDRLEEGRAVLALDLPAGLRHLELDGAPLAVTGAGEILVEKAGPHTLVMLYAATVSGNDRWGRAQAWVPTPPTVELTADLPGARLVAAVDRSRNLRSQDRKGATRVEALLPPGNSVQLSWEERGVARDLGSAPPTTEKADLSAEAITVYRIQGADLQVETALRFTAGPPGVNRLRVVYDDDLELLAVEDDGGKPWPRLVTRRDAGTQELLLGLPARQSGTIQAKLRFFARPTALRGTRSGGESVRLDLPRVRPMDVGRAPEYLGVVKDPRTRVRLHGAFQPKDRTELPNWCPQTVQEVDGPVGRFAGEARVALEVEPLRTIPTQFFRVLDATAVTIVSRQDRQALSHIEYNLQNSVEQFLRVDLPAEARLLGAEVRGEPVKPGTVEGEPGAVLIALPTARSSGTQEPAPMAVSLVYTTPLPSLAGRGRLALRLARPGVPVEKSSWTIYHPRSLVLEHSGGRFQPQRQSYMDLERRVSNKLARVLPSSSSRSRGLMAQGIQSNIMPVMNFEDPRQAGDSSRDMGLLPVEIRLPQDQRLAELGFLDLVQGSVARGSDSWSVEVRYVDTEWIQHMARAGTLLVALGCFLLLLWLPRIGGGAPGAPFGAGLGALAAGLALGGLARGASAALVKLGFEGLFLGLAGALLFLLATPFRRLGSVPVAAALLLALHALVSAAPGRVEVLVPVPEKGPQSLATGGGTRVLVPTAALAELEAEIERRARPTPPEPPDELLLGDQEIEGHIEAGTAHLVVRIPLQVRGRGPWSLTALRGDLALEGSTLKTGSGRARDVTLTIERDAGQRQLEEQALTRYAGYLAGRSDESESTNRVRYRLDLQEPSPRHFTSYLLEVRCLAPVQERSDGGYSLELDLPSGAARHLLLDLPDEVRVQVAGDPHPTVTERVEATRVSAFPGRQGSIQVAWNLRAGHARRVLPRTPEAPAPGPEGPSPEGGVEAPDSPPRPAPREEALLALGDWETQIEVGEEQVRGVAQVDVQILQGSLDTLTLTAPPAVKLVAVEGPRVAEHRPLEAEGGQARYAVRFESRRTGRFPIKVSFRLPLEEASGEGTTRRFQAPVFQLEECADQRGRVGFRVEGSQEVRPVTAEGFEPAPTRREEVLAFSAVRSPRRLELEVESLPAAPVFPATVVSSQAKTSFLDGETRRLTMAFTVKNNGRDFLTFRLPEGTVQESLELIRESGPGGRQVLPRVLDRHGNLQVPLPQPTGGSQEPVTAAFRLTLDRKASPPKGWTGREVLLLPVPDVPLSDEGLSWNVVIEKGFRISEVDPRDGRRVERPFGESATVKLRGFLPTGASSQDPEALSLRISYLSEGTMLALFLLLGLGLLLLAAGLPLVVLGRIEYGFLPRVAALAVIAAGGVLVLEAEIPLPGWIAWMAGLAGALLGTGLLLRSWRAALVVSALLLLPRAGWAAPPGLDLRYLPAEEAAGRVTQGGWSVQPLARVLDLSRRAQVPESQADRPATAPLPPRIRAASHQTELASEAAHVVSRYQLEGRSPGPWPLLVDLGPDAAVTAVEARRGGKALTDITLIPEGGPGSPTRGLRHPGVFRVRGLAGEGDVELELRLVLPVARQESGGTFQVAGLPAPSSRFEVRLPEPDLHVEVFPHVASTTTHSGDATVVKGWLKPSSTFAVRWTARSTGRHAAEERDTEVREATRFDAEVFPQFILDGRRLQGEHRIQLHVGQGSLDQFRVRIPAGNEVLAVTGTGIARHLVGPDSGGTRTVDVLLSARKSGSFSLGLRTLQVLGEEEAAGDRLRRRLEVGEVVVEGAQRQSGDLRLDIPPGVTPLDLEPRGATRIDPRETRPPAPPTALVFRYLAPGVQVALTLERFPAPQVRELSGKQGEVRVVPLGPRLAAHVAHYTLVSRGNQSLALQLPEDALLVSSQVDGRPVKAGRAGPGRFRVPLTGGAAPGAGETELRLDFVYIAPSPEGHFVPPALPETTLESLTVSLAHRDDRSLRVAGGPYRALRRPVTFFDPVEETLGAFPSAVGLLLTAPVTVPLVAMNMVLGGGPTAMRSATRQDRFSASEAPMPPPPPGGVASGRAGGGMRPPRPSPADKGRLRRAQKQDARKPQAPRREAELKDMDQGEGYGDGDGLDDAIDEEPMEVQSFEEAADPAPQQAAFGPPLGGAYATGADLLVGEGFQGSLPVPLDFRAPDLSETRFETRLLAAGEAPRLELAALPRWQERLLRLLSLLLAATGTFLLLGGALRAGPGGITLIAGLGLGLWLSWTHGIPGDSAWSGVALGLLLALVTRIGVAWRRRAASSAPDNET